MAATESSSSRPTDPAFAVIEGLVAELREAEALARSLKDKLRAAVPLDRAGTPDGRRIAAYLYWNAPDIPTQPLAMLATGLTGRRAEHAFFQTCPPGVSSLACGRCGGVVDVGSRDEERRLKTAKAKRGADPICVDCRPKAVPKPGGQTVVETGPFNNCPLEPFEREVLELHVARGEAKWVNVVSIWGGMDVELKPDQIALYLRDPDLGAAAALGVGREDYLTWLETGGSVGCDGVTTKGNRCRNAARGLTGLDLGAWNAARQRGGFCTSHGG